MRILAASISLLLLTACGILPTPMPDRTGQVRVPWVLTTADGDRLEVAAMVGGHDCDRFEGVDVIESDRDVEIRAWVTKLPAASLGCFMVGGYEYVTVTLGSPLGTRALTGCMIEESGAQYDTRETCADLIDL